MTMTWDVGSGYSDSIPSSSDAVVLAVDQTDTDSNNDSDNESTTVSFPQVDLEVTISENVDPVVAGSNGGIDNLVHTITVTNNGPATATNIVIQFGANTTTAPTLAFQAGSQGPGGNEWSIPSIALGNSVTMTLTWDVGSGYSDSNPISSNALVLAVDQTDTDSNNDSDNESTTVSFPQVDLEVTISENVDPVIAGSNGGIDNLVHTITVTNNGPATATNIVIQFGANTVPSPTLAFQVGSQGPGGNEWSIPSIASGNSATMTMTWDVGLGYSDTNPISSDALVLAVDQTDTDSNNDSATESTTVNPPAGLDICAEIDLLVDEVNALLNNPGTPRKSKSKLIKAKDYLNSACDNFTAGEYDRGFNDLADAADELNKAMDKGANADAVRIATVDLARLIATETIADAQAYAGDPAIDHLLNKAAEALADGDVERADDKFDKAVKEYGKAWEYAAEAIQLANNTGTGGEISMDLDPVLNAIDALLANNPNKKARKALQKAHGKVTDAQSKYDNGDIEDGYGKLEDAVGYLEDAADEGSDADPVIADLLTLGREYAVAKITEAQTYAGTPEVDQQITKAQNYLNDGDAAAAQGKNEKAMDRYGKAWIEAQEGVLLGNGLGKTAGEPVAVIPTEYGLDQNYPNPFNPETTIRFALPQSGNVTLKIFNLSGQLVRTLVSSEFAAGQHQIVWNGRNDLGEKVASGMYLYRITAGSFVQTKKMMLMK
ncbi:MAG: T9SS type A sorting domain-containing protein [Calditrichae bacterium]|nr:T9SS type A sorting domain-containing protein [Calditrichia bacterium]